MRRLLAVIALVVAPAFISACGSDGVSAPASTSVAGTYMLSTVNGVALPIVVSEADPKIEMMSDRLTLSTGGTFTEQLTVRITDGTRVTTATDEQSGTFIVTGTLVLFTNSDNSINSATFAGNTLTSTDGGVTVVFVRQ